jgi:hypothetical protein
MSGDRYRRKSNRLEAGAGGKRQLGVFVAEPAAPLIGLRVKVDRPVDRDQPCCRNICSISHGEGPHAGELICADCGQHRGWLSTSTAHWIEQVISRFGAPTTPIVVRQFHTYKEETPAAETTTSTLAHSKSDARNNRRCLMRSNEAFPSKFLKSADVKAKPIVATISHMEMELVGQGQEQKQKPVLYLEDEKPMVLNRTNFEALEDAFGDSDDWPGHKIKIKCECTKFQGKTVDGLRTDPILAKPASKNELNDKIDF